jgi:hypothetical protein
LGFASIALLVAAGCGDSAGSNGEGDLATAARMSPMTKAEFVKRADALCREAKDRFDREFDELLTRRNSDPPVQTVGIVVRNFGRLIDQIGSLEAPRGDERQVDALLDALQQRLDYGQEHPSKFLNNPPILAPVPKLARAYGLTGCANSLY